jgi:WXXGXW repeat (2 copies)
MKKTIVKWVSLLSFLVIFSACGSAQRVSVGVRVRPNAPVFVRPLPPSRGHVWIDGDWVWRNGGYVYQQGYWVLPRRGQSYVPGHWKNTRYGYQWIPGRWKGGRQW